jgi:methylamine---glutamate N-methyltransferase subunit A
MCGLAGIVLRERGPLGADLVALGRAIRHRGFDSTGFALYDSPAACASLDVHARTPVASALRAYLSADPAVARVEEIAARDDDSFLRVELAAGAPFEAVAAGVLAHGGMVHAAGHAVRVIKDVGDAADVDAAFGVAGLEGTHGLVHNRLATESLVDVDSSHPFWASPFADVTVIHHGHITNYDRLRRTMEGDGFRFLTANDSELAAVWLGRRMAEGAALEQALEEASATLDGIYLLLVGTRDGIGAVRDRYGACPLVIAEDERCIAFGSELQALLGVVAEDAEIRNLAEEAVITWSAASTAVA